MTRSDERTSRCRAVGEETAHHRIARRELLRYLVQQEDGRGAGIGGQTLVTLDDERCYCGGEETGLRVGVSVR